MQAHQLTNAGQETTPLQQNLNKLSNLTSGRVYWNVLHKERAGEYLGHTVQIIPHVTGEIKRFVYGLAEYTQADVVITEIGGTIGDIESQPFLEAIYRPLQPLRAVHGQCFCASLIAHGQQKSGQTADMVRVKINPAARIAIWVSSPQSMRIARPS